MEFSRWQLFKVLAAIVCTVGIVSLALSYFIPAPPSKVVMATAFKGASFEYYGRQYREVFARYHVDLELRETAGAVENVKLLQDPKSDVSAAHWGFAGRQTMKEVHSGSDIFHHSGEFPNATDTEYTVAPTAIDFYKNGPSFMQRHLPLWLSVHVQRAIAVLVTGIAIGFPLFRFLPQLYNWMTRRRLFYWYGQLKALEASFETNPDDKHLKEKQAEIERIEDAVSHIRFPLTFSDQVYNLRSHIDIVRRKIASRNNATGQIAAE